MDFWPALIQWLTENAGTVLGAVTSIVGGFALLAALTPNKSDDSIIQMILKAINFLGANFGKAKNDPQVK